MRRGLRDFATSSILTERRLAVSWLQGYDELQRGRYEHLIGR
jgi:hypothetical protein